jgi:hypothetical protein
LPPVSDGSLHRLVRARLRRRLTRLATRFGVRWPRQSSSSGSQPVSGFRPQAGHDFSEVPGPQPEGCLNRGVLGPQVAAGREDRGPGVSEAQDMPGQARQSMRMRRGPGSVSLQLVGAMRRQHHAGRDALDESRLAALERRQNLWGRSDTQRTSRQLERRMNASVDRPTSCRTDKVRATAAARGLEGAAAARTNLCDPPTGDLPVSGAKGHDDRRACAVVCARERGCFRRSLASRASRRRIQLRVVSGLSNRCPRLPEFLRSWM